MAPTTKRRRSARELSDLQREEEDLTASLFGGKRSRRSEVRDDFFAQNDEEAEDYIDREEGSSSRKQNAEQLLDDDNLFMLDTGGDRDEEADGTDQRDEQGEEEDDDVDVDDDSETDDSSNSGIESMVSNSESDVEGEGDSASSTSDVEKDVALVKTKGARRRPVWTDPSVSNLTISLAGSNAKGADGTRRGTEKLRKLREEEGETQITGEEYELRLRKLFEKIHPRPSWASISLRKAADEAARDPNEKGREALSNLLSRDTGLVESRTASVGQGKRRKPLVQGRFDVERLRNANEAQGRTTFSPIENVAFHPTNRAHIMMTTTKDRRLRLFHVDGNVNPMLETLHVVDLPMQSALFHPSGSSILLSGPRPFFYSHDLESGKTTKSTPWRGFGTSAVGAEEKDLSTVCFQAGTEEESRSLLAIGGRRGAIHLLEWGSVGGSGGGSLVGSLQMNAPLAGLAWNRSASHSLVSLSTLGTVHSWDVRNMKCEVQRTDAGLYAPKGIHCSPDGDWWAVGSESGIVNMYGSEIVDASRSSSSTTMNPQRSIKNVTTTTTDVSFNHSSEVLAIASDKKKDSLKLVHTASMTVFENWPTAGTPLGKVTSVGFSNKSEYLAIGNSRGKVLLYSLQHYNR